MLTIDNLTKYYRKVRVLDRVGFTVGASELAVIIGPSGSGKSTLLRCLNGLEPFDVGEVRVGDFKLSFGAQTTGSKAGDSLRQLRREVGMVFQSFNLFPHLTLLDNVQLAPRVARGMAPAEAGDLARQLLAKVGLSERLDYFPLQLSGGEQQRAAIARALAMRPHVMLYDEPTSALDPGLVGEVLRIMRQLDDEGMTQIVVTHEMKFAREAADRILVLIDGQLVEDGSPEKVFNSPCDPRTWDYLRRWR